jgi:hypothetical protein
MNQIYDWTSIQASFYGLTSMRHVRSHLRIKKMKKTATEALHENKNVLLWIFVAGIGQRTATQQPRKLSRSVVSGWDD